MWKEFNGMTLKIIGWACLIIAVISIFSAVKTNKPLPLVIAAVLIAACYICLSYPF